MRRAPETGPAFLSTVLSRNDFGFRGWVEIFESRKHGRVQKHERSKAGIRSNGASV
jgi:hypothetical protein